MSVNQLENNFKTIFNEIESQGFGPVNQTSNGYRCFCPCHGDTGRPNLDIAIVDEKILMHCKSCGVNGADVLSSLKLELNLLGSNGMKKKINFKKRLEDGLKLSNKQLLRHYAKQLNTSVRIMQHYSCFCKNGVLYYPERDFKGQVIGIAYRDSNGDKKAQPHSNRGLLLPISQKKNPLLFVTEGASDCFALS